MESLGINLLLLFSQLANCLIISLGIGLVLFLVRAKKPSKFFVRIIGFLTAWVTIYSALFLLISVSIFIFSLANPLDGFNLAFKFHESVRFSGMITVFLTVGLIAYYMAHAAKSPLISEEDRIYYQVAIFFLSVVIMPMYYQKFIKNEFDAIQKS
jgi:hypothetical protein